MGRLALVTGHRYRRRGGGQRYSVGWGPRAPLLVTVFGIEAFCVQQTITRPHGLELLGLQFGKLLSAGFCGLFAVLALLPTVRYLWFVAVVGEADVHLDHQGIRVVGLRSTRDVPWSDVSGVSLATKARRFEEPIEVVLVHLANGDTVGLPSSLRRASPGDVKAAIEGLWRDAGDRPTPGPC